MTCFNIPRGIMHKELTFPENSNEQLANLNGSLDEHLRIIERSLNISISYKENQFKLEGDEPKITLAKSILTALYHQAKEELITPEIIRLTLQDMDIPFKKAPNSNINDVVIKHKQGTIRGRSENQKSYLLKIVQHAINFGIGPAGTGKTFLAVACAVNALEKEEIRRIVLVRPAVEAGERLGFLPGDLTQKVDPYLRPLYDALYEMLGVETVMRMIERNIIEIAPLAFMRGRTLNDAFIILDEAQNTTIEQMKMFLTRLGFNSTAVITGDTSQVDLPKHITSGLKHAINVLKDVDDISMTFFQAKDVVRHPLVAKIIDAYAKEPQV